MIGSRKNEEKRRENKSGHVVATWTAEDGVDFDTPLHGLGPACFATPMRGLHHAKGEGGEEPGEEGKDEEEQYNSKRGNCSACPPHQLDRLELLPLVLEGLVPVVSWSKSRLAVAKAGMMSLIVLLKTALLPYAASMISIILSLSRLQEQAHASTSKR